MLFSIFFAKRYSSSVCLWMVCSACTCTYVKLRHTMELYLFYECVYAMFALHMVFDSPIR